MTLDPEPGRLLVRPVVEERQLTLLVFGEADFSTAVGLHRQLVDAMAGWPYTVVIDVSGLTFCGLAGLDALREAELVGAGDGRDVHVTGMSRQLSWLRRTFGATGNGESSPAPEGDIVRASADLDERA
jgi:anti-anti-sigma regulatory factor